LCGTLWRKKKGGQPTTLDRRGYQFSFCLILIRVAMEEMSLPPLAHQHQQVSEDTECNNADENEIPSYKTHTLRVFGKHLGLHLSD
jgi:hypothetical protein